VAFKTNLVVLFMFSRIPTTTMNSSSSYIPFALSHDVKISARNENTFPWRLHIVLDAAEREGFSDIVSWIDDSSFKVHDAERFVDEIMPRFFQQTKYKSFQRQCNLWGFDRISNGPQKGGYVRKEYFVRGDPALVARIQRMKIKGPLSKRLCRKNGEIPQSVCANSSSATIANGQKRRVTDEMNSLHPLEHIFPPPDNIPQSIDISVGCSNLDASHEDDYDSKTITPPPYNEVEVDDLPMNFDDLDGLNLDLLDYDGVIGDDVAGVTDDAVPGVAEPADLCTSDDNFPLLEDPHNEDQEPTPTVHLHSNETGNCKSSLIDYLVDESTHQSSQIFTLSTATVSLSSSSSISGYSATSMSSQESQNPLSAICAALRNPCRQVPPKTNVRSCLEHEAVARDRMSIPSNSILPLLRESPPANPTTHDNPTASLLSSKSYFLSFSSKNVP
jgi:hypothetical protein